MSECCRASSSPRIRPPATAKAARLCAPPPPRRSAGEIEARSQKFAQAPDTEFALAIDGTVRWIGEPVAKLSASDKALAPRLRLLADEQLTGPAPRGGADAARHLDRQPSQPPARPVARAREGAGPQRARQGRRLSARRGARRRRPLEDRRRPQAARPGAAGFLAQARRPLRRLPRLSAAA